VPDGPGELRGEDVDRPLLGGDLGEAVVDLAVVQVEKGAAVRLDQEARVAVQPGILHVQPEVPPGDRHLLAVGAGDDLATRRAQLLDQLGPPEPRHHRGEVTPPDRGEEVAIEMIAVLVAHVDEARLARVFQLLPQERRQVVVLRELHPRRTEGAVARDPRVRHHHRPLRFQDEACVPQIADLH